MDLDLRCINLVSFGLTTANGEVDRSGVSCLVKHGQTIFKVGWFENTAIFKDSGNV